jgi:hypothetical protein
VVSKQTIILIVDEYRTHEQLDFQKNPSTATFAQSITGAAYYARRNTRTSYADLTRFHVRFQCDRVM